jgi:bla regulator protein blaR1
LLKDGLYASFEERYMARDVNGYENHSSFTLLLAAALIAISGRLAPCQTCYIQPSVTGAVIANPSEPMPAYEVATIKPSDGKDFATPLRIYIQQAFGISPNIAGRVIGPAWIENTRYAIEGKPPDSTRSAMQTMTAGERAKENALMKQSLLADRFQLKAHFETREMPLYQLVVAKGGSKLKEDPDPAKHGLRVGTSLFRGSATIPVLISTLECAADIGGREVIDKTGLTGVYDFSLKWTPMETTTAASGGSGAAATPDVEGASLFTAVEEQLGLKLVPAKGPGQVLVIDHIEQPSAN